MPILKSGQQLAGYEILAYVARGGMGEVYRARQLSIGRDVALKLLAPDLVAKDPQFAERFVEEARAAGSLSHPNIVGVHDVGKVKVSNSETVLYYFSMEFIDGTDVRAMIREQGPLELDTVAQIMIGMVEALAYAEQRRLVHRDIKPENIMVTEEKRVKLADFGIATNLDDGEEVERDEQGRAKVMGTPRYMSPEQARAKTLDWRSDQYSLGATLYHMLTGEPPYRRDTGKATMKAHVADPVPDPADRADLPRRWSQLVMRMMAKKPDDRYQTADDLRNALQTAITGGRRNTGRRRASTVEHVSQPKRHVPLIIGIAAVVLLAVVGLVFVLAAPGDDGLGPTPPDNGGDENTVDLDQVRIEKAEALIAELPDDPRAAAQRLEGPEGLQNPYYRPSEPAMTLLRDHLKLLQARISKLDAQESQKLASILARVEELLDDDDLSSARNVFKEATPELAQHDQARYDDCKRRLSTLSKKLQGGLLTRIGRATTDTVDTIAAEAERAGLDDAHLKEVQDAIVARRQAIADAAERAKANRISAQQKLYDDLVKRLHTSRRSDNRVPDVSSLLQEAHRVNEGIDDADLKKKVDEITSFLGHAQQAARALDGLGNPGGALISFRLGTNKVMDGEILAYDAGTLTIAIEDDNGGKTEVPLPFDKTIDGQPAFNTMAVLDRALKDNGVPPKVWPEIRIAHHWMWSSDAANSDLLDLEKTPFVDFLKRLDPKGVERMLLQSRDIDVDFAIADANALRKLGLSAKDITEVESGKVWRWESKDPFVPNNPLTDAAFPGASMDTGLTAPKRIVVWCSIDTGSKLLIGIGRTDGGLVRAGFRNNEEMQGICSDGAESAPMPKPRRPVSADWLKEVDEVEIEFLIEGDKVTANVRNLPLLDHNLSGKGAIRLVFQTFQPKGARTGVNVRRILVQNWK